MRLIFTMILLMFCINLKGQEAEIGIKGGGVFSNISKVDNTKQKLGFVLGLYIEAYIPASSISIQPEFLYARYGAANSEQDAKVVLDYIQVPVLAKYNLGLLGEKVKPSIYLGPYVGFISKAEQEVNSEKTDLEPVVKDAEIGFLLGTGIKLNSMGLDLRYTQGLSSIYIGGFDGGEKSSGIILTASLPF